MMCPRCDHYLQQILEDDDKSKEKSLHTFYCSTCKSSITKHFYKDGRYKEEWMDFGVKPRKT